MRCLEGEVHLTAAGADIDVAVFRFAGKWHVCAFRDGPVKQRQRTPTCSLFPHIVNTSSDLQSIIETENSIHLNH
jgi:hypothetical protein